MHNSTIFVTGGASGLGKALCLNLAGLGHGVVVADIDAAGASAVAAAINAQGGRAAAVSGDLTRREGAFALFEAGVSALGPIHGLANVAGVYPRRPLLEILDEDWDLSVAVNLRGLYHMSVAAIEHMRTVGGGRIVNVSSIDAFKAHPKNAHYAAVKAAVVSLTKSMAVEFAIEGILINGVAPAAIATDKAKAAGFLPELAAASAIGRAAEPDDIADVIAFLLSEKNRYMVGETVAISGGYFIP